MSNFQTNVNLTATNIFDYVICVTTIHILSRPTGITANTTSSVERKLIKSCTEGLSLGKKKHIRQGSTRNNEIHAPTCAFNSVYFIILVA